MKFDIHFNGSWMINSNKYYDRQINVWIKLLIKKFCLRRVKLFLISFSYSHFPWRHLIKQVFFNENSIYSWLRHLAVMMIRYKVFCYSHNYSYTGNFLSWRWIERNLINFPFKFSNFLLMLFKSLLGLIFGRYYRLR